MLKSDDVAVDTGPVLFNMRCWVGVVGFVALVNAIQCYWDQTCHLRRRLYILKPAEGVSKSKRLSKKLYCSVVKGSLCHF